MDSEATKRKILQLRTELAFAYGNSCHGGPSSEDEMRRLRKEIEELVAQVKQEARNPLGVSPSGGCLA